MKFFQPIKKFYRGWKERPLFKTNQTSKCFHWYKNKAQPHFKAEDTMTNVVLRKPSLFKENSISWQNGIWEDMIHNVEDTPMNVLDLFWALYVEEARFCDYITFSHHTIGFRCVENPEEEIATFHHVNSNDDLLVLRPKMVIIARGKLLLNDNRVFLEMDWLPAPEKASTVEEEMDNEKPCRLATVMKTLLNLQEDETPPIFAHETCLKRLYRSTLCLKKAALAYTKVTLEEDTPQKYAPLEIILDQNTCLLGFPSADTFLKNLEGTSGEETYLVHLIPFSENRTSGWDDRKLYARVIMSPSITDAMYKFRET